MRGRPKKKKPRDPLAALKINPEVLDDSFSRIPATGPVIAVANHPFGGVEALILDRILRDIRDDVKIMGDQVLKRLAPNTDRFLMADPLEKGAASEAARQECIDCVKNGGMAVLFPAREVSHLDLKRRAILDPKWRRNIARIIRKAGAPVVPIFFGGSNSVLFHILGLIHTRLSAAVLPPERSRAARTVQVRVGSLILFKKLNSFESSRDMTAYLRIRTYVLNSRSPISRSRRRASRLSQTRAESFEAIAEPQDRERIIEEVRNLPPEQTLGEVGEFAVLLAEARQIPHVLLEIGRLREMTFREVGEGSGKGLDLDRFDEYYLHLFVWSREKDELVGAYRLGLTDQILPRSGRDGLYTATLFKFKPRMLQKISPAVELGRSFVRSEYQKSYAPLMLLWKGIGGFVLKHPHYRFLFGPVSINEEYNSTSRQLMIRFLKENNYRRELAKLVKARKPIRAKSLKGWDRKAMRKLLVNIDDLSTVVSDIEADQKGVPVLLKQYLRLGGKLLGCNVDPEFSNVLDALLLVDLVETDPKILARYMGKERAGQFLAHHNKTQDPART